MGCGSLPCGPRFCPPGCNADRLQGVSPPPTDVHVYSFGPFIQPVHVFLQYHARRYRIRPHRIRQRTSSDSVPRVPSWLPAGSNSRCRWIRPLACMNSSTPRCRRSPSHTPSPSMKPLSKTDTFASGRHTRSKAPAGGEHTGRLSAARVWETGNGHGSSSERQRQRRVAAAGTSGCAGGIAPRRSPG